MLKKISFPWLFLLLVLLALLLLNPVEKVRSLFFIFQKKCSFFLDSPSVFSPIAQATLCGTPFTQLQSSGLNDVFTSFGLIHLVVASGANIHFVHGFIKLCPGRWHLYLKLFLFPLMLSASALATPLFRAFLQIQLKSLSECYSLGLNPFRRVTFANLLYLTLFPWDLFSLSFQLSAIASYSLALVSTYAFFLHVLIFLIMAPLLVQFQVQDPISIVCNILIAPVLGPLLLVFSFILGPWPSVLALLDPLLQTFTLWLKPASHYKLHSLNALYFKNFKEWTTVYFIFCILIFELIYFIFILHYQRRFKK